MTRYLDGRHDCGEQWVICCFLSTTVKQTEDVIVESEESGEDGDETPGETIKELKARKAELRQRVEDQARDKHTLQVINIPCR